VSAETAAKSALTAMADSKFLFMLRTLNEWIVTARKNAARISCERRHS